MGVCGSVYKHQVYVTGIIRMCYVGEMIFTANSKVPDQPAHLRDAQADLRLYCWSTSFIVSKETANAKRKFPFKCTDGIEH